MLITSRRTAARQSIAEVLLTGVSRLEAVIHGFIYFFISLFIEKIFRSELIVSFLTLSALLHPLTNLIHLIYFHCIRGFIFPVFYIDVSD